MMWDLRAEGKIKGEDIQWRYHTVEIPWPRVDDQESQGSKN
jgi:hypothetical protein